MQALEYPFDSDFLLKKAKKIKKQLLEESADNKAVLHKKIAVLGGSTTHDIIRMLDLFLLNQGIRHSFMNQSMDSIFRMPCLVMQNWMLLNRI